MPKPTTDLRQPDKAAAMLYAMAERLLPEKALIAFPYNWRTSNRPELDKTWWVSPPGPAPRYRHGKIVCTSNDLEDGAHLFIGLYVEKGITPALAQAKKQFDLALQDDWVWHAFLDAMRAGELDEVAADVEQRAGCAPTLVVDAGVLDREPQDVMAYRWSGGELTVLASPRRNLRGLLRALHDAHTLADLAKKLPEVDAYDNLWIDLSFGFMFWTPEAAGTDAMHCPDEKIWRASCAPWSVWIR